MVGTGLHYPGTWAKDVPVFQEVVWTCELSLPQDHEEQFNQVCLKVVL